jgi:hypothetical protein
VTVGAAVRAGTVYFAIVFAAGFVLGAARVLVIAPLIGELGAVIVELPIMLAVSWIVCGSLVERFRVPPDRRARLTMGAVAFALLMAAEFALSVWAFGRSVGDYAESFRTWAGVVGLAGQLAFAALPLLRMRNVRPGGG